MDIPPQFLLLLPLSLAAGVDLYLTLFVVGVVFFLDLGEWGGTAISIHQAAPVLLGLAGLFFTELVMDSRPTLALLWHNLQLLLRPFGAALLGLLLFQREPTGFLVLAVAMATIVSAFSHVLVWGKGILLRITPNPRISPLGFKLLSDLAAAGLLALTLLDPDLGALLATLLLLLGLIFGRDLHGAVRFGWTLWADRVWGIVSPTEWQSRGKLPRWALEEASLGPLDSIRGARAATWGIVGPGRFKDGWILQKNREFLFAFRQSRDPRLILIDGKREGVELGSFTKTIRYRSSQGVPSALFLQLGLNDPESHK